MPTSDETYRDMGVNPDVARDLKRKREYAVITYAERKERLRFKWQQKHGRDCPVYKAHGIPFESCGSCQGAFEAECEKLSGERFN